MERSLHALPGVSGRHLPRQFSVRFSNGFKKIFPGIIFIFQSLSFAVTGRNANRFSRTTVLNLSLVILILLFILPASTFAQNRYARVSGAWNSTATWSATSGGATGASIPGPGDNVYISEAGTVYNVTIPSGYNAQCANINFFGGAGAGTTLSFASATSTLAVGGNFIVPYPSGGYSERIINIGAGSVTVGGDLIMSSGNQNTDRPSTISISTGTLTVTGDLVFSGGRDIQSKIDMSGGAGTLDLKGNFILTYGIGMLVSSATSTVRLSGTGTQALPDQSSVAYSNIVIDKASGTVNVANNLTASGNISILNGTLNSGTYDITLSKNWTNNGTYTTSSGAVVFDGSTNQSLSGTSASNFNNFTISNSAGVTLGRNITVDGSLSFVAGKITTGAYTLTCGAASTISGAGAATGHVVGNFNLVVPVGATTKKMAIGTATTYAGIDLVFAGVSTQGTLSATTTSTDHPNIASSNLSSSLSVNRYWTISNSGVVFTNYSAAFTFAAADQDGGLNTTTLEVRRYNAGWSSPTVGTRTSTSTQATGLTAFGDFQIGQYHSTPTLSSILPASVLAGQTIDVVFTGTGFVTNYTTVNVGAGMTLNSVTVNSPTQLTANISISAGAAIGTRNLSVTTPAPGGGTSGTQVFTIGTSSSWKGTVSTNWSDAGNWTSGVPTSTIDAVIGDANFTGGFQPTVNAISVCKSLTVGGSVASTLTISTFNITVSGAVQINANGTISHTSTAIIQLTGNWTNSGTYTAAATNVPVIFAGTTTLSGSTVFGKFTVNAGAVVTHTSGTVRVKDPVITAGGTYLQQGGVLQIDHDWKNSGTYTATGGTIQFVTNAAAGTTYIAGVNQFFNILVDAGVDPGFTEDAGVTFLVAGNFTNNNAGLADLGTSTFKFNGSGSQTFYTASVNPVGNATIDKTGGTLTLASAMKVTNFTVEGGGFSTSASNYALVITGNALFNGGAANMNSSTVTVTGTWDNNGTNISASSAAITVTGNFTSTDGTFIAPSSTLSIGGNWTNNNTNQVSVSSVAFTGATKTIGGTVNTDFPAISVLGTLLTMNTSNSCTSLTFPATTNSMAFTLAAGTTLTVNGDININQPTASDINALNINTATVIVNGNVNIGGTNTSTGRISKIVISTGTLDISGNLVYNSATGVNATAVLDMAGGAGNVYLAGNMTLTNGSGTLTPGTTSTFTFDGTGSQTVPATASITYNSLTINKASGTATLGAALTVVNLSLLSGTFNAAYAMTISGNVLNNGGTLTGSPATTFTGITKTISGTGTTDFGTMTFNLSTVYTMSSVVTCTGLTFPAVNGNITLNQTSGSVFTVNGNVTINQPTGSSRTEAWNINAGTATVTGNINIGGTNTTTSRVARITITTGTLHANGNIVYNSSVSTPQTALVDMSGGAGILNLKGSLTLTNGTGTLTPGTSSTVNFNGTLAQSVSFASAIRYYNIYSNNAATVTISAAVTGALVTGNMIVQSGVFSNGGYAIAMATSKTFQVDNGATFKIVGTTGMVTGTTIVKTFGATSTVEYGGTNQTVSNELYGHLTLSSSSGAAVKTMPSSAMTIAGNLTSSMATGTSVSYTALANTIIGGTVNIGSGTTFSGGSFTHSLAGNWVNNGTYTASTSTVTMTGAGTTISGSGTHSFYNLTITGSNISSAVSSITVSSNLNSSGDGSFTHSSGTFTMSGTSRYIAGSGFTFNDLSCTGTISSGSDLLITGNLSAGAAGTFSTSGGTLTMSGSSKTITATGAITLYNLTVTGSVSMATNLSIYSTLIVTGTFSANAGTTTFTNSSSLSGTANLYNVTLNCTSLQLTTNSILGIANAYTVTAGTLDVTSSTPNTVHFNGSSPQNIAAGTFHHLMFSNGAHTPTGVITTNGDFTINASASFTASSSYYLYVKSNFINNGTFTPGSGTVQFDGAADGTITGTTTFYNIIINKSSTTNTVTVNSNISVGTIIMTQGVVTTGTNTLNITSTRTGPGIILGWIQRTHAFTTGVAYEFESPYNTITFSTASGLTSILVKVTKGAIGDFPFGGSLNRLYDISIPAGTYTATLRLHYEDAELNGNTESAITLWKYSASWATAGKSANSTTNNWVEQTGITSMTTRWTCSDDNNVMSWNGSVSSNWNTAANWSAVQGAPGSVPSANDIVQIGISAFTNAPTISTAATAKSITFGSTQAATLTVTTGGSLTTQGNISGTWSSNATHTINAGAQNITVNGDVVLSDGTSNHVINLNIGTGTVTITGSLTESGGANISFSGAGALLIGGNFNYSSGTFTPATGTVTFNGSGAQAIGAVNYNHLVINKTGIATISNASNISGNLTVTAGELDINAASTITGNVSIAPGAIFASGNVNNNVGGNWTNSGTFNPSTGTITLNGPGTQTISAGPFNNLTINKTGGATLNGNITLGGNISLLAGTLALSTYTANRNALGGSLSMSNGTTLYLAGAANFPANYATISLGSSSTVEYNGSVAQGVAGISYGNLVFTNGAANAKTLSANCNVTGNLTINSGASFNAGAYTLNLAGNWTNSGTFTPATSTINLTGTAKSINGNSNFYKLTATGTYSVPGSNITTSNLFYIPTGGSIASTTGTITISGDITNNGTLTSTGTTTFTGTGAQTIQFSNCTTTLNIVNFNGSVAPVKSSTSSPTFATVNINNTGGVTSSIGWNVTTAFNIASGASFNGSNATHNISGSFTNDGTVSSSGTLNFTPAATQTIKLAGTSFSSTGTVIFGGTGAISVTGTPATLTNITISNSTGVTPASNWTLAGNFLVNSNGIFNAGSYSYTIAGDLLSSGTLNGGTSTFTMSSGAGTLSGSGNTTFYDLVISGTVSATANYNVSHNFTNNGAYDGTNAVLNMTGSAASIIGGTAVTYNLAQLSIQKTGGASTTLAHNILAVANLEISTGILDASTYTIAQDAGGGSFSMLAGTSFKIGGTNSLPGFSTYSFDSTSTVEYNGGVQSISAATPYGNLVLSTAGNKTAAAAFTVQKNITITNATFIGGSYTHLVGGNWSMASGSFTNTGTTISFNGTMTQTVTSTATFNNITVNKSESGIALGSNITFSGTLTFTSGIITTGSYAVITTSGTVSGAGQGTGWVNGSLQRTYANGTNVAATFQVGGATYYSPATLTFASISGGGGAITVSNKDGAHPNLAGSNITPDKNIPRYWTVTNTGGISFTTYTISLTWNTAENYPGLNTTVLSIGKYTSATWSYPTITGTPNSSNVQANGITNMGDFVVGEKCDVPATFSYTASPYCSNAGTASVTYNNGGVAGVFSASPPGLSINTSTGQVNLSLSTPGTYTVTNTTTGTGGCVTAANATIVITAAPSSTISYTGGSYCSSAGTATVTRTGTSGGTYSSTAGLTINATTGTITLATSTAGTYTVTYTIASAGGCAQYSTNTSVTITAQPAASISYAGSPYCSDAGTAPVTFSGTTGGTFSSTAGLTINATTGAVTSATSTDGTYTVTYTVAAAGGCGLYTTNTSITINTQGKWSGAVSTAWSNAANWQCGVVPTGSVNVVIPTGLSNYPTISSGTYAVNDITIASGASLIVTGATLQIGGAVTNSGTFTASAGTIEMNGASQTIATNTYNNLLLSGSGTKTAGGALVVNGVLTVNSNIIFDMVSYDLTGTLGTVTSSGTIRTQSISATPIPSGKTWMGTVEYNKTGADQTVAAGNYNNLLVTGGSTKSLGGAISLLDSLTLGTSTLLALGNYDVTLKSTATAVARIANTPASADISYGSGRFVVERYVPGRRKYRLFGSSVTSSPNATLTGGEESLSIWGNWQNSGNNVTQYTGTIITGGSAGDGFDTQTTNPSMFNYDDVNKRFVAHSSANGKNTKYTPLKAGIAYYLFIYGDRTNTVTTSNPKNTTISSRGKVLVGDQAYSTGSAIPLSGVTNRFTMLGNPFASPINWATVTRSNIANTFWGWDPNLNSTGGYVTVSTTGTVTLISPFSGTVGLTQHIQPGQGFFVKTTGASPTMTIKESDKVSNFNNIAFFGEPSNNSLVNNIPLLAVNLQYASGPNMLLADGAISAFSNSFSNTVGEEDATKIAGSTEAVAVQSGADLLSIDARKMPVNRDTIFLNMARITRPQYTLQIFAHQMTGSTLSAFLEDTYLNTSTPLSLTDTNRIVFTVSGGIPASSAANRFRVVFRDYTVLPVVFRSVKASQKHNDNQVEWSVSEETNTIKYEVEHSTTGSSFSKAATITARGVAGAQDYSWLHVSPAAGSNYYRVKAVNADGSWVLSNIVQVKNGHPIAEPAISVFPNPVVNQQMNLLLSNMPKGIYNISLVSAGGQVVFTQGISHNGGSGSQSVPFGKTIAAGIYYLRVENGTARYSQAIKIN